ncbi:MAG: hypothetical protein Q9217_000283 [Psora testacea]
MGLLPLLKSIHKPCNLKKFAGQTIGVDAYGWLHRGTVACAIDLALEKPTRKYIDFSMNRVRMLIHFGIVPYLVFDGDYLPSKAVTEIERAKRREESKRRGLELYHMNKPSQAHLELQKAVDVTPRMARELIEELKTMGVQYIVAPYEADAQLVYLEKKGIIQGMLSEDSDLLVFGARRLLTKLDQYGDCIEINRSDFTACRNISLIGWSDAEFRRMAILSGCDYLASIPGMGLKNAYRLVRKYKTIEKVVRMLQFDGKFYVPTGYLEAFYKAELTFLHQRVFCPLQKDVVMMTDIEPITRPEDLSFIGAELDSATAIAVATGDLDPVTKTSIIIPKGLKHSLKTPWNNMRRNTEGTPFSEMKGNKSINAFFRAQRTPLAELDPNSFTPSPTQERLLQQARGMSWPSSPAPSGLPTLRSSVSIPSATSRTALSTLGPTNGLPGPLTGPAPSKRRRLFHEPVKNQDSQETEGSVEVRSRFFAAKTPELNPSLKQGKRSKKAQNPNIDNWSDDSVEDAMAELPDISDVHAPQKTGKFMIFRDDHEQPAEATVAGSLQKENSPVEDSQTSVSSRGTVSSEASVSTSATSFISTALSTAQTLDKCVNAELVALATEDTHHRSEIERPSQADALKIMRQSNSAPVKDRHSAAQSPLPRQKSRTPLQRLGAGALSRSRSCSGLFINTAADTSKEQIVNEIQTIAPARHDQRRIPNLPTVHTVGPEMSTMRGSEDAMIPDSEDDISDENSEVTEQPKPRISLGHFAFTG